jgi:hypothetical protein
LPHEKEIVLYNNDIVTIGVCGANSCKELNYPPATATWSSFARFSSS